MCLPLLIFPCTIESRSSLLAPAHPAGPGKRAINRCGVVVVYYLYSIFVTVSIVSAFVIIIIIIMIIISELSVYVLHNCKLHFITAQRSYASVDLGVVILSVRLSVCHTLAL